MDLASDHIDAGLVERHLRILVRLAIDGLCAVRDHAVDGVDIMSFIGGDEVDRVAGLDAHQLGVKHEKAGRAAVQLLHLELIGTDGERHETSGGKSK